MQLQRRSQKIFSFKKVSQSNSALCQKKFPSPIFFCLIESSLLFQKKSMDNHWVWNHSNDWHERRTFGNPRLPVRLLSKKRHGKIREYFAPNQRQNGWQNTVSYFSCQTSHFFICSFFNFLLFMWRKDQTNSFALPFLFRNIDLIFSQTNVDNVDLYMTWHIRWNGVFV